MALLFLLSKEDIELAKEEVLALTKSKNHKLDENLLILNTKKELTDRLAYTHYIFKLLFKTKLNTKNFIRKINSFNWNKIYKNDFCVRVKGKAKYTEPKLADLIWKRLRNPKVSLNNAKTNIFFIFTKDNIYATKLISNIKKDYDARKSHNRDIAQPYSLHPKLARAMVNLTGIQNGEIVDPFCGTGGILIEAGLMGLKPIGYDINPWMLKASEKNLKQFKIKSYILKQNDATKLKDKIMYLTADLPYSRNTKMANLDELYFNFLNNLKKLNIKK